MERVQKLACILDDFVTSYPAERSEPHLTYRNQRWMRRYSLVASRFDWWSLHLLLHSHRLLLLVLLMDEYRIRLYLVSQSHLLFYFVKLMVKCSILLFIMYHDHELPPLLMYRLNSIIISMDILIVIHAFL